MNDAQATSYYSLILNNHRLKAMVDAYAELIKAQEDLDNKKEDKDNTEETLIKSLKESNEELKKLNVLNKKEIRKLKSKNFWNSLGNKTVFTIGGFLGGLGTAALLLK